MEEPIKIVIYMEGGLIQDVCADRALGSQVRVVVVDSDVEGVSAEELIVDSNGCEVRVAEWPVSNHEEYVKEMFDLACEVAERECLNSDDGEEA